MLVDRTGRMSLVDFNTATINGSYACAEGIRPTPTRPMFANSFSPSADAHALAVLDAMHLANLTLQTYRSALAPRGASRSAAPLRVRHGLCRREVMLSGDSAAIDPLSRAVIHPPIPTREATVGGLITPATELAACQGSRRPWRHRASGSFPSPFLSAATPSPEAPAVPPAEVTPRGSVLSEVRDGHRLPRSGASPHQEEATMLEAAIEAAPPLQHETLLHETTQRERPQMERWERGLRMLPSALNPMPTLADLQACVAKCRECSRCHAVSVSSQRSACIWFAPRAAPPPPPSLAPSHAVGRARPAPPSLQSSPVCEEFGGSTPPLLRTAWRRPSWAATPPKMSASWEWYQRLDDWVTVDLLDDVLRRASTSEPIT